MFAAEGVEFVCEIARVLEAVIRASQHLAFPIEHPSVIDALRWKVGLRVDEFPWDQTVISEPFGRDQKRVARKRRERRVRRIAVSCRRNGEHLPVSLARLGEPLAKLKSRRPEVANSVPSGERCRMQKNPCCAIEFHRQILKIQALAIIHHRSSYPKA